jgi:ABC-type antimicrobial peptide transport system permease subunit
MTSETTSLLGKKTHQFLNQNVKESNILYIALVNFWSQIIQTLFEIRSRKLSYLLGVSSCIVVVWMSTISYTALSQVPLVFLRLAEVRNGEYDLGLSASSFMPGSTLNYSLVHSRLPPTDYFSHHTPRHNEELQIYKLSNCTHPEVRYSDMNLTDYTTWMWMYNSSCPNSNCVIQTCPDFVSGGLHAISTDREKLMGFGRQYSYQDIPRGMAYISQGLSDALQLQVGDVFVIPLSNVNGPFVRIGREERRTYVPLKVGLILPEPFGKYSSEARITILTEFDRFLPHWSQFIPAKYTPQDRALLSQVPGTDYATDIYFNIKNRLVEYNERDYDVIQNKLIQFSSRIMYFLGYNQLDSSFPILRLLFQTRFISLFLGLIITIIITILSILAVILIYSLLLINVETKTFEFGVMRMLGMTKTGIISLVLLSSFSYSLPGWIIGLIVGQLSYVGVGSMLSRYLDVSVPLYISWQSMVIGSLLGLLIPVGASIFPIMAALGKSLHDALDTGRSKTEAIKYHIDREADVVVDWPTVLIGCVGTIFGFGIYYFMPLSLLSFNLTLLLYLFFGILMAMLFGLVVLSLNVETVVERTLTLVFFFWENAAIRDMVNKNLISHRIRNRKTTIMFCLSLAFIIFISVSFDVQTASFRYENLSMFGTRINLIPRNLMSITNNLAKIESLLSDRGSLPYLKGWTYMSYDLRNNARLQSTTLTTAGRFKRAIQTVRAVAPNFYKVLPTKFLIPSTVRNNNGWDFATQLYTPLGSSTILLGSLYEKSMDLKLNSTCEITMQTAPRVINRAILKPLAFAIGSPGVNFSSFPIANNIPGFQQDGLVSFPTFLRMSRMTQNPIQSMSQIGIERIFLDIGEYPTDQEVTDLRNKISRLGLPITFSDVEDRLRLMNIAMQVMVFFFIFTTIVAMFMCFFSLAASMYSNIFEQAKEIGILRAIGARKFSIVRIFVYEAFILILSSGFLGVCIGIVIAYTMVIQRTLFTQLPIPFVFPWAVVLTIFCLAIVFSVLSSFFPVLSLQSMSIVDIMRRLTT